MMDFQADSRRSTAQIALISLENYIEYENDKFLVSDSVSLPSLLNMGCDRKLTKNIHL